MRAGAIVDVWSFAELLRETRLAHGLTQEELAERAQLSARATSDLERGLKRAPRSSTVRLLAEALELTPAAAAPLLAAAQTGSRDDTVAADERTANHNLPRQLSSFVGRTEE